MKVYRFIVSVSLLPVVIIGFLAKYLWFGLVVGAELFDLTMED